MKHLVLAAALLTAAPAALADDPKSFYTIGYTYAGIKVGGITLNTNVLGGSVGWMPLRWLGLEGNGFWGVSSASLGGYDVKIDSGYMASVLPTLPLGEDWSLYGRVGYMNARISISQLGSQSDHDTALGVGAQWVPHWTDQHMGARLEYTQLYHKDGLTIDGVTVSFVQKF
jgi:hypothetical protein